MDDGHPGLDLDDFDGDNQDLPHGYLPHPAPSACPQSPFTMNDNTSDLDLAESIKLHILLKKANIRPPLGLEPLANRDRRPRIEAIVNIPGVGGGLDAIWKTKDGGGTSVSSGASFPLWNQDTSLTVPKGSTVSIIVAEYWCDNQERKRVCGTAKFEMPGSQSRGGNGERVYEGWLPLKNEHGGSEGKVAVAISTEAEYIENIKMGLAPVTSSGGLMPINDILCLSSEVSARRRSTEGDNFSLINDQWGADLAKLGMSPLPQILKDASFSSTGASMMSGSSVVRTNDKPASLSADCLAIKLANVSGPPCSDTFALDGKTLIEVQQARMENLFNGLSKGTIGLSGQEPFWI